MTTALRRPAALVAAGFLAGCAAVLAYSAATDSSPGLPGPMTNQQQYEQFKSQFPSR